MLKMRYDAFYVLAVARTANLHQFNIELRSRWKIYISKRKYTQIMNVGRRVKEMERKVYLFEKASCPRNECMKRARHRRHKRCEWGTHVGSTLARRHEERWGENISDSVVLTTNFMHPMSFSLVSIHRRKGILLNLQNHSYDNRIFQSLNPRKKHERTMPSSARRAHLI